MLQQTFRALDDGSLTDIDDNAVPYPAALAIGIVHPLELAPETRDAWHTHLADYEISAPFPQFDRPIVQVKPEQRALKFSAEVEGTVCNGMKLSRAGGTPGLVPRLGVRRREYHQLP